MLNLTTIVVGPISVNCHIVWNPDTLAALVFDPGADFPLIQAGIEKLHLKPFAVLLTHGHVDHIGAVPDFTAAYHVPVWMHPDERGLYLSPRNELLPYFPHVENLPPPADELPAHPGFDFQVLHTPGHTPGGVCYYFPEQEFVLTGDTLFASGVGRTDLPGGDPDELADSIHDVLFALPGKTVAYPGHYDKTTIGIEKINPMLGI